VNPDQLQKILLPLAAVAVYLVLSLLVWKAARKKNRNVWGWFLTSLLVNPLIVYVIILLVPQKKPG
jgi:hypothetical protein